MSDKMVNSMSLEDVISRVSAVPTELWSQLQAEASIEYVFIDQPLQNRAATECQVDVQLGATDDDYDYQFHYSVDLLTGFKKFDRLVIENVHTDRKS